MESLPNTWFFKTQERSVHGIPDYICCVNGNFVALELKRAKSEEMKGTLQEYTLSKIEGAKGFSAFVYPENFELIKENLIEMSKF